MKRIGKLGLGIPGDCGQRRGEGGRGPRPPRPGGCQDRHRDVGAADAALHLLQVAAGEGMPARHHFVEYDAQRPDIVGFLGRAAGEDLGRAVGQVPPVPQAPCQAELTGEKLRNLRDDVGRPAGAPAQPPGAVGIRPIALSLPQRGREMDW